MSKSDGPDWPTRRRRGVRNADPERRDARHPEAHARGTRRCAHSHDPRRVVLVTAKNEVTRIAAEEHLRNISSLEPR